MRLLLSGGGFRATLYHLGVIAYLRQANLLNSVNEIYSVSGGSILAAHLVLHWEKYAKLSDEEFEETAIQVVKLTQSDVRGKLVRWWLFGILLTTFMLVIPPLLYFVFEHSALFTTGSIVGLIAWIIAVAVVIRFTRRELSRIALLKKTYEGFYKQSTLKDLQKKGRPQLRILATNLTTGKLVYFDSQGICLEASEGKRKIAKDDLSLGLAVAASSAFPPLFPPVALTRELLLTDANVFDKPEYLSDGGVYDNLGIQAANALSSAACNDPIFVSNAERRFDSETGERFGWLWKRATRASDIMMDRITTLEIPTLKGKSVSHADLREDSEGENVFLPPTLQRSIRSIRTDLDRFSPHEIQFLVYRGFAAAREAVENKNDAIDKVTFTKNGTPYCARNKTREKNEIWLPFQPGEHGLHADAKLSLERGAAQSLGVFNWYDLTNYLNLSLILAISVGVGSWWFVPMTRNYYRSQPVELTGLEQARFLFKVGSEPGGKIVNSHSWILRVFESMIPSASTNSVIAVAQTPKFSTFTDGYRSKECVLSLVPQGRIKTTEAVAFLVHANNSFTALKTEPLDESGTKIFIPHSEADSRLLFLVLVEGATDSTALSEASHLQELIDIKVSYK